MVPISRSSRVKGSRAVPVLAVLALAAGAALYFRPVSKPVASAIPPEKPLAHKHKALAVPPLPEEDEAPLAEPSLRSNLQSIVSRHGASLDERSAELLDLQHRSLGADEEAALRGLILNPKRDQEWVLKNDCIETLARSARDRDQLCRDLSSILRDESRSAVVREYITQYLPEVLDGRESPSARLLLTGALEKLLDDSQPTLPGAALLCLLRLQPAPLAPEALSRSAQHLLVQGPGLSDRVAAAQALALLPGSQSALNQILADKDAPPMLSAAARKSLELLNDQAPGRAALERSRQISRPLFSTNP